MKITSEGIESAISGLNYRNPNTAKARLIQTIKDFYDQAESVNDVKSIDTDTLIDHVWDLGGNSEAIKSKRKNISSIKSSVNADLDDGWENGKNPEGIIIGPDNTFEMSNKAKDSFLSSFSGAMDLKGNVSMDKVAEALNIVTDFLSGLSDENELTELSSLKSLVQDLSDKLGDGADSGSLSLSEIKSQEVKTYDDELVEELADNDEIVEIEDADEDEEALAEALAEADDETYDDELVEELTDADEIVEIEDADEDEEALAEELAEAEDETYDDELVEELTDADEIVEIEDADEDEEALAEELAEAEEEALDDELVEELTDADEIVEIEDADEDEEPLAEALAEAEDETYDDELVEELTDADEIVEIEDADEDEEPLAEELAEAEEEALDDELVEELTDADEIVELEEADEDEVKLDEDVEEVEEEFSDDELVEELTDADEIVEIEDADEDEEPLAEALAEAEDETYDDELVEELTDADEIVELEEADEDEVELDEDVEEVEAELNEDMEEVEGEDGEQTLFNQDVGLPIDALTDNNFEDLLLDTEQKKLLAEQFDGYLGAMERYYNQYVLVPAGEYSVGSDDMTTDRLDPTHVVLPDFYAGRYPVTNALFEIFVERTGYQTTAEKRGFGYVYSGRFQKVVDQKTGNARSVWNPTHSRKKVEGAFWYQPFGPGSNLHNKRNHPVVQVSIRDAVTFAAWTGKRLPTEIEWEAASRTEKGYTLPWGNEWQPNRCNTEDTSVSDTVPVDHYPDGMNPTGLSDLLGNVMEWTADQCEPKFPVSKPAKYYVAKGGAWTFDKNIRLYFRSRFESDFTANILGFRCVVD